MVFGGGDQNTVRLHCRWQRRGAALSGAQANGALGEARTGKPEGTPTPATPGAAPWGAAVCTGPQLHPLRGKALNPTGPQRP